MTSARDLSNLKLAHEIIVNRNFRVEPSEVPENRYDLCERISFALCQDNGSAELTLQVLNGLLSLWSAESSSLPSI